MGRPCGPSRCAPFIWRAHPCPQGLWTPTGLGGSILGCVPHRAAGALGLDEARLPLSWPLPALAHPPSPSPSSLWSPHLPPSSQSGSSSCHSCPDTSPAWPSHALLSVRLLQTPRHDCTAAVQVARCGKGALGSGKKCGQAWSWSWGPACTVLSLEPWLVCTGGSEGVWE